VIELLNMDCIDYLRDCEDNAFDLAIVDPPYGVKRDKGFGGFGGFGKPIARTQYKGAWDSERPQREYFDEVRRVSALQIIWGGNFFADLLPAGTHWIFWDKVQTMPTFGDGELAWTNSGRKSIKKHTLEYNGLLGRELTRIHPTQKPVKLYDWLLSNYAKEDDRILDTHLGSGSSAIAAHYGQFDFVGIEIDEDYFNAAKARFEAETAQLDLLA